MAEFAQTVMPDDLFDDDYTPIPEPEAQTTVPSGPRARGVGREPRGGRGERGSRARGRGRGRGVPREGVSGEVEAETAEGDNTAPPAEEDERPKAVRGDRSGTGGIKKARLTEDELADRLAKIKIKNAELEAAHRRAAEDEALFRQRERQEAVKRQEERASRRAMEDEREKNRRRKLGATQGREWDVEKKDSDDPDQREGGGGGGGGGGSASQYRRGAHGGVMGERRMAAGPDSSSVPDGMTDNVRDYGGGYTGPGRGFRGRRGGGRGDRRGFSRREHHNGYREPVDNTGRLTYEGGDDEFPSLPSRSSNHHHHHHHHNRAPPPRRGGPAPPRPTHTKNPLAQPTPAPASSSPPPPAATTAKTTTKKPMTINIPTNPNPPSPTQPAAVDKVDLHPDLPSPTGIEQGATWADQMQTPSTQTQTW